MLQSRGRFLGVFLSRVRFARKPSRVGRFPLAAKHLLFESAARQLRYSSEQGALTWVLHHESFPTCRLLTQLVFGKGGSSLCRGLHLGSGI